MLKCKFVLSACMGRGFFLEPGLCLIVTAISARLFIDIDGAHRGQVQHDGNASVKQS